MLLSIIFGTYESGISIRIWGGAQNPFEMDFRFNYLASFEFRVKSKYLIETRVWVRER